MAVSKATVRIVPVLLVTVRVVVASAKLDCIRKEGANPFLPGPTMPVDLWLA